MRFLNQYNIIQETRAPLEELTEATGETSKLGMLFGGKMVYLNVVESRNSLRIADQIGAEAPTYCTAMGKLLLAMLPETTLERVLARIVPMVQCTPNSITDLEQLLLELKTIRSYGYAIDEEEYILDSRGIAVPVYGQTGRVVAAVSISGPTIRLSREMLLEYLPLLRQTAEALNLVREAEYAMRCADPMYEDSCENSPSLICSGYAIGTGLLHSPSSKIIERGDVVQWDICTRHNG